MAPRSSTSGSSSSSACAAQTATEQPRRAEPVRGGDPRPRPEGARVARHVRHARGGRARLRPRRLRGPGAATNYPIVPTSSPAEEPGVTDAPSDASSSSFQDPSYGLPMTVAAHHPCLFVGGTTTAVPALIQFLPLKSREEQSRDSGFSYSSSPPVMDHAVSFSLDLNLSWPAAMLT
jgi:hypothetical protein